MLRFTVIFIFLVTLTTIPLMCWCRKGAIPDKIGSFFWRWCMINVFQQILQSSQSKIFPVSALNEGVLKWGKRNILSCWSCILLSWWWCVSACIWVVFLSFRDIIDCCTLLFALMEVSFFLCCMKFTLRICQLWACIWSTQKYHYRISSFFIHMALIY